jgi:hypothetical protein
MRWLPWRPVIGSKLGDDFAEQHLAWKAHLEYQEILLARYLPAWLANSNRTILFVVSQFTSLGDLHTSTPRKGGTATSRILGRLNSMHACVVLL